MCLSLGAVCIMDVMVLGFSVHSQAPILTPLYLLHTVLLAVAGFALIATITRLGEKSSAKAQIASTPEQRNLLTGLTTNGQQTWVWISIALGAIFPALFIINPHLFNYLALEDGIIETIESLMYFISFGVTLAIAIKLSSYRSTYRNLLIFLALGGALVLLIMGGEEISWGQRLFHLETPEAFTGNHQNEMNFHNFATNAFETVAYCLSMLWLLIIPFINDRTDFFNKLRPVALFIPGRFLIFVGAITTTYYFTLWEWEIEPIQLGFYIGVSILVYYWRSASCPEADKGMITILLILLVGSQLIFIAFRQNFGRQWDLKEYRELFIPLGYLVYLFDVFYRVRWLTQIEAPDLVPQ
ncbi:MAG: hypothetical protein HGA19_12305 [Oscillochloris sp.]|nr:hypothetical protein [Oscillochloris sp.]